MNLAFVTIFDPYDIHAWSGTGFHILKALQCAGFQTQPLGKLKYTFDFIYKTKEVLYTRIFFKTYKLLWDTILQRQFAIQVERRLASTNFDVVFSVWTNPIAYLRTEKPIVFWGDATFAGLMNFNPHYRNLCAETVRDGNNSQQLALSKCHIAIYSSEWAANTAIRNYDVDPAKVKVVPFGANITCDRDMGAIREILSRKTFEKCNLLFVGVDWFWKGGKIAVEVTELLNKRGINTELHIVGCNPPGTVPSFVKLHGFVSKKTQEGQTLLDKLFRESHFLILPTRAECYGIVFAEASSYGLPSLATDIGGIPTAIHNDKNGHLFPLDDDPQNYCEYIVKLLSSKQKYEQLALSSFREYSERLNWTTAGRNIYDLLHKFCS